MTNDPTSFNLPEIDCLQPSQIDNVARALIALLREHAVLQDRLLVLEDILTQNGLISDAQVDAHQPSKLCVEKSRASMASATASVIRSLEGTETFD